MRKSNSSLRVIHLRATPNYFGQTIKSQKIGNILHKLFVWTLAKAQFVSLVCTIWGSAIIAFHAQNCPTETETDSKEEQRIFYVSSIGISEMNVYFFFVIVTFCNCRFCFVFLCVKSPNNNE